jgi:uncharacterized protein
MISVGKNIHALDPSEAALDAVKSYVRMNRDRLIADGELMGLLFPERFDGDVRDLQRFVIEQMAAANKKLRAERDALKGFYDRRTNLSETVRRAVLDLVGVHSFGEAATVAENLALGFGADTCAFCAENPHTIPLNGRQILPLAPGTVQAVVGDGLGAILSGGGALLFGKGGEVYASLAAFRLRLDDSATTILFIMGSCREGRFDGRAVEADLRFFALALERALSAHQAQWLAPPTL